LIYTGKFIYIFFNSQLLKPKLVRRNYESACVVSSLDFHCVINFFVLKAMRMHLNPVLHVLFYGCLETPVGPPEVHLLTCIIKYNNTASRLRSGYDL